MASGTWYLRGRRSNIEDRKIIRSSVPKIEDQGENSSIFRLRRSKNLPSLPSSEPEDRRISPIYDLRSSTPKIEEPATFGFRPRRSKIDEPLTIFYFRSRRLGPRSPSNPWCNTCRIQNPDIPRTGRGGAAHREEASWGGAGRDRTPTCRFAQERTDPLLLQGVEDNCPERLFGGTNK